MHNAVENLQSAFAIAEENRPKVGGFPYLAEILRQAGATRNHWLLPSGQSTFWTTLGTVVIQGEPLQLGFSLVPKFNEDAVIKAIRDDQAGLTTFPEFLLAAWTAGVLSYDVDFENRKVSYFGSEGEVYVESYPEVTIPI